MAFSDWRTWTTGEVVTAAHMNQEVRDNGEATFPDGVTGASWSPTLEATGTNPAVSSVSGRQYQVGAFMFVAARFVRDTSDGSGTYFVTLPKAAVGLASSTVSGTPIGTFIAVNSSPSGESVAGVVFLATSDTVRFRLTDSGLDSVAQSVPFSEGWDTGDVLTFSATYLVA